MTQVLDNIAVVCVLVCRQTVRWPWRALLTIKLVTLRHRTTQTATDQTCDVCTTSLENQMKEFSSSSPTSKSKVSCRGARKLRLFHVFIFISLCGYYYTHCNARHLPAFNRPTDIFAWLVHEAELYNISETGQDSRLVAKLLLMTNKKSHARCRLVPKLTIFDDLAWTPITHSLSKYMRFRSPPVRAVPFLLNVPNWLIFRRQNSVHLFHKLLSDFLH